MRERLLNLQRTYSEQQVGVVVGTVWELQTT